MNKFFIAGLQRSGTTLLAVLLGKHPAILMERQSIAFRVITCFNNLYDLQPYNLEVDQKDFLQWLIKNDDKGRLAALIDYQHIKKGQSIRDLIQQSIDKKLQENNKQIWGDKSPNVQHYISDMMLLAPDTKILHIIRDGRANAYSMSKRSSKHLLLSAQEWVDGNIFGLVNQHILGKENYKIIHYEDLLRQPEEVLPSVCAFLNLPFAPEMMDLSDAELTKDKSYVKSFFDTSKIDKWKQQLTAKEIRKIEAIQGPLLKKMGYELMTPVEELIHRPLSIGRRLLYSQGDNVKQLFTPKRIGMKNRQYVEIHTPFKKRLYAFFRILTQEFLSMPIFKSLFSSVFYKEKYFTKEEKSKTNYPANERGVTGH